MDKEKENEFNTAYDLYADMLYKIAYLHTADKDESEDILQEVFIKLLYKSPSFKDSEHKKAWLIKTTTNQCKDFLKSSRRKNLPLNDEILGEEIFDDKKLDVRNKLLKLDSKYKTVLYLYYYEDYTVEMIANTLSLSKSNVKMRLKRGRELLKMNWRNIAMTDEKKIIKEAIDDIKPDVYMKTRLQAKIEEPKRKSAKSFLKPALSCTLALAVLAGVGTYGMTRDNTPVTSQTSNVKLSSHSFNIVAYAQDENGNKSKNITLGENDVTTLKNYRVKAYKDSDGYQAVKSGCESGFAINAKNVAEATFESEKGKFSYYDMLLQSKLIDEGKFYVEIPLTDEENKLYHDKYENKDREFYNYLSKHKDLSKYFNGKSQNAEDYGIYYSDKNDYKNENQLLLAPVKYYDELSSKSDDKKISVKTYRDGDKIQDVYYSADDAIYALIKNPDLKYEDLPSDTITITVKFKDGQKATKKIKTSFNSKGQLQLQYVK